MIAYSLIRSRRKTISIEVREGGAVIVRAPWDCKKADIEAFIQAKEAWILEKTEKLKERQRLSDQVKPLPEHQRSFYREKAREVLEQRTAYYAARMGVTYGRIAIREQKTRWGSCSSLGNLNFNWKLILTPPGVLDYVVVHELAHRKEMNHSRAFWQVVAEYAPDYQKYRNWLREYGMQLQRL